MASTNVGAIFTPSRTTKSSPSLGSGDLFQQLFTISFNTINVIQSFASEIGRTGKWRGEAVEDFVVRTTFSDREPQLVQAYRGARGERVTNKKELSTPPAYASGSTFFFKIKFEEPYLMYNEW
ncbi:hypothetical protein FRC12_016409 [Ceratobasidium sp. 428]|nr:hypothetical protein FRC12_016409 [Ceratobasidium sp. 428]